MATKRYRCNGCGRFNIGDAGIWECEKCGTLHNGFHVATGGEIRAYMKRKKTIGDSANVEAQRNESATVDGVGRAGICVVALRLHGGCFCGRPTGWNGNLTTGQKAL